MSIKKTMALYRELRMDFTTCAETIYYHNDKDYIRISELVEVEFIPLGEAVTQEAMIKNLIEHREELEKETEVKFNKIDQKLQDLRALTAPEIKVA